MAAVLAACLDEAGNATRSERACLWEQTSDVLEFLTMGVGWVAVGQTMCNGVTVLGSVRFGAADQA